MARLEVKKSPYVWAFAALLVLFAAFAIHQKVCTFKEGAAFIVGALAFPALLGSKNDEDEGELDKRKHVTLRPPKEEDGVKTTYHPISNDKESGERNGNENG